MYSYKNIFLAMLLGLFVTSCKKNDLALASLSDFTAKADSVSAVNDSAYYQLGSVTTFTFTGNPVTLTFYSGELGKRYKYSSRTSADGTPLLIFTHTLNAGTQDSTLHVMLSSDFKGYVAGDSATTVKNIAAATWSDITPAKILNRTASAIDTVNLSGFAAAGKKVFVAFKYTAASGSVQNKWTINNLALNNYLPDTTQYTIANLNAVTTPITNYGVVDYGPGWGTQNVINTFNWVIASGSSLTITGATTAAAATSNIEAWVLTGTIDLKKVTPDRGTALKDMLVKPQPLTYRYSARGRYDAYFDAGNGTIYESGSIQRKVPIVIQ